MGVRAVACPASLTVRGFGAEVADAWDDYVYSHPNGSLFHGSAWKRAIERSFGFEARYLLAEGDGRIRGVLPLFLVQNVIQGRSLISTPFAVYGGICASDEQASIALREAACRMAERERVRYLELREAWPAEYTGFQVKRLYVTFDTELPRTPEELLKSFPRDTRYMIRKAQKSGLSAVVDNGNFEVFYNLYSHSVRNLGTPVFSRTFFRVLLEEFGNQAEICTVRQGSRALAAVLSFRFRDGIFPYYGGSLAAGRVVAANNFMYWEVMKRAIEQGVRFYDFGRSKLGTGAYSFKTQWNMRERPLPYQIYLHKRKTMPNYSPANPRFKLLTSVWKRLPLALTQAVGPSVVRLFP